MFKGVDNRTFVSTHSRLKAAGSYFWIVQYNFAVSTHSRLKAAGKTKTKKLNYPNCFNTQPPEGGWRPLRVRLRDSLSFNTQPPEGGWQARATLSSNGKTFQHTAA